MVNLIAVVTLLQTSSLLATNIYEEYKLFHAIRISISLAILSEFFIAVVTLLLTSGFHRC